MTSTTFYNMTQAASSGGRIADSVKIVLFIVVFICFFFFLYFISLILHIFFTTPHIREHARYILFAHMLINDILYLVDGLFLFMASMNTVYLPFSICCVFISLGAATFRITPYNLAAMALERYVAICFPLRHLILCTVQRSNYGIALIWVINLIPSIIELFIQWASLDNKFFSLSIICRRENVTVNLVQSLLRFSVIIISLVSVGLIIAFTYVRVMYIAKDMSSRNGSAVKAGKTVMLHAVQFLLCLFSLTSSLFETQFGNNVFYLSVINFLIFMCLPRVLSPIIYGLRDQMLSKCIRNLQPCKMLRL